MGTSNSVLQMGSKDPLVIIEGTGSLLHNSSLFLDSRVCFYLLLWSIVCLCQLLTVFSIRELQLRMMFSNVCEYRVSSKEYGTAKRWDLKLWYWTCTGSADIGLHSLLPALWCPGVFLQRLDSSLCWMVCKQKGERKLWSLVINLTYPASSEDS